MSTFVVADYFVGRSIVNDSHLTAPDYESVELTPACGDLIFGRRNALQPISDGMLDGISDALTGPFRERSDHLVGFTIFDEYGHSGLRIY
jgi:hypothetical protein